MEVEAPDDDDEDWCKQIEWASTHDLKDAFVKAHMLEYHLDESDWIFLGDDGDPELDLDAFNEWLLKKGEATWATWSPQQVGQVEDALPEPLPLHDSTIDDTKVDGTQPPEQLGTVMDVPELAGLDVEATGNTTVVPAPAVDGKDAPEPANKTVVPAVEGKDATEPASHAVEGGGVPAVEGKDATESASHAVEGGGVPAVEGKDATEPASHAVEGGGVPAVEGKDATEPAGHAVEGGVVPAVEGKDATDSGEHAVEGGIVPSVEAKDATESGELAAETAVVPEPSEPAASAVDPTTSVESTSSKEVKNVNANVHPMFTKDSKKAKTVAEAQAKAKAARGRGRGRGKK